MDQKPPNDKFLTLKQVTTMLGISRSTLWRWAAEQGLKVVRVGGVVRIRESELEAFLKRHEVEIGANKDSANGPGECG